MNTDFHGFRYLECVSFLSVFESLAVASHPLQHLCKSVAEKKLSPNGSLAIDSVLELAIIVHGVEVAFRFCDESIVAHLPKFISADANTFSGATRSGVGSCQRPMELGAVRLRLQLVKGHDHVRKCCHERLCFLGDRGASNRGRPVVN